MLTLLLFAAKSKLELISFVCQFVNPVKLDILSESQKLIFPVIYMAYIKMKFWIIVM